MGYVPGHVAGHDDGHGVVGGGAVAQGDHGGNAHLSGFVALHHPAQLLDDPCDAAVFGDQLRHTAAQQRQEEHFIHTGKAGPHALGEAGDGHIAGADADDTGGENTDGQGKEHVQAAQRQHQHQQVGRHLDEIKGQLIQRHDHLRTAHDQQQHQRYKGRRQGHQEVDPELVPHLAALAAGGGNGGVGDHGQVIAEHGAAHHGADDHCQGQAALFRDSHRNGDHSGHGAHGGAGGGAHKGGDHKQARRQKLHRNQGQAQIHRGLTAAHVGRHLSEGTRQNVDHQHGQDVHIGRALGKHVKLLVDGALEHDKCRKDSQKHGGDGGELVKRHLRTLYLIVDTGAHIDGDKDHKGDQRQTVGLFFMQGIFHTQGNSPFSILFLSTENARAAVSPRRHFPKPIIPDTVSLCQSCFLIF